MAITFRHDAAAIALPSNSANRKYGQSLALQQQKQKYQDQQAGYDRVFQLGRDQQQNSAQAIRDGQQNAAQTIRDVNQNAFLVERDQVRNDQQQRLQRAQDFAAARTRIDTHAQDMLNNGQIKDFQLRKRVSDLIDGKRIIMGSGFNEVQQQEFLDKYNGELAKILSEVPPPPPKPTRQDELKSFLGPDAYEKHKDQPWVPDGNGGFVIAKVPEKKEQPRKPTSADEAFQADPKARDKYMEDAKTIITNGGEVALTEDGWNEAAALARRLYEKDNGLGATTSATELPVALPASPHTESSIPEASPPGGQQPAPSAGLPPAAPQREPLPMTANASLMNPAGAPQPAPSAGLPPAAPQREPLPMTANASSMNPAGAPQPAPSAGLPPAAPQQQVKVGGKPLVVTPGTLTPQETAAKAQVMEMPREQRIAALMQYDPSLKGQTLEQLLESPETKAGYEELTKQGLTTGNYREDMLTQLDEMLQYNVLNGAGQSPPDAYVGMRADDITDPKAKAEIAKMPRPKTADEMKTIRGSFFIDPDGIIRGTKK